MMRAPLNIALLSATALATCSRPTISTTKDWRTGMSNRVDDAEDRGQDVDVPHLDGAGRGEHAHRQRHQAGSGLRDDSGARFGRVSAMMPPNRPSSRTGANWRRRAARGPPGRWSAGGRARPGPRSASTCRPARRAGRTRRGGSCGHRTGRAARRPGAHGRAARAGVPAPRGVTGRARELDQVHAAPHPRRPVSSDRS